MMGFAWSGWMKPKQSAKATGYIVIALDEKKGRWVTWCVDKSNKKIKCPRYIKQKYEDAH